MNCIKYLMFFFNFLFWLSGLILIIIGAIVRDKYGDKFAELSDQFANAPVLIIVVGVIVFIIGFLGCCGAVKENYCMVTTFAVLLALIFILEIVAGSLGVAYRGKAQTIAEEQVTKKLRTTTRMVNLCCLTGLNRNSNVVVELVQQITTLTHQTQPISVRE